jgi:hypothetical protein
LLSGDDLPRAESFSGETHYGVRLEHERILVRTRGGERIKAPAEKLRAELRRCPDVERVLIRSKGEDVGTTPLMHISLEQKELKVERPTLFKWRAEYTYEVQASFKPYDRPRETPKILGRRVNGLGPGSGTTAARATAAPFGLVRLSGSRPTSRSG